MGPKKPIHQIRQETVLAKDTIKPYGDRVEVSSESKRHEMALKLLSFPDDEDEDEAVAEQK